MRGENKTSSLQICKEQRRTLTWVPCYFHPAASCRILTALRSCCGFLQCVDLTLLLQRVSLVATRWPERSLPALRLSASQADFPLQNARLWPPVTAWFLWGKGLVSSRGLTFPHQKFPVLAHHLLVHVFRGSLGGLSTFKG